MDTKDVGCEGMNWIYLAQDRLGCKFWDNLAY